MPVTINFPPCHPVEQGTTSAVIAELIAVAWKLDIYFKTFEYSSETIFYGDKDEQDNNA